MTAIAIAPDKPALSFARSLPPLLLLAIAMAAGFTMMMSFSTVQEAAKAEMGLSDHILSMLQGVSAAVPLVLFSIPIGIWVDRTNRVRMMIILGLIWTAGTLLTAMADSVWLLFVARMMAGVGTTGALTAALSLAADYCRPDERGRAMLIVNLGKSAGQAAAFALVGWLFGMFLHGNMVNWFDGIAPWRATHYALAALSFVLVIPFFFLREPERREGVAGTQAPFRVVAAELWSRRRFLGPLFAGQVTVVMADAAAAIWAAPVLARDHGLGPEQFAGWMGALMFFTGIGGSILGGFGADLGQKSGRRGGLLIAAIIAAIFAIPAALFPLAGSVTLFAVALGALVVCGTITGLITSVALTTLIPNELRGLCIGAFIAIAGLIGFGIAPSLVTLVSSLMGGEHMLGEALAIVGVCVSIASLAAFMLAMRNAPENATSKPI